MCYDSQVGSSRKVCELHFKMYKLIFLSYTQNICNELECVCFLDSKQSYSQKKCLLCKHYFLFRKLF